MPRRRPHMNWLVGVASLALAAAPLSATAAPVVAAAGEAVTPSPSAAQIDPSAQAAYTDAQGLLRGGDASEAVARLDLAIELEPNWPAPLRLRAQAFGELARRYHPGAAFLSAQAADLERLLVLEPGIEAAARRQQIAALHQQSRQARDVEQRRRNLTRPAILVITASAAMMVSGGLMLGFIPSTSLDAYAQRRYVYTGATMLAVGVALAVPAITLGVLAGRQGKRDSALADFNVRTDSRHAHVGVAPQLVHGGGGMALRLRF